VGAAPQAGADPEAETPGRDVVQRDRLLGQHTVGRRNTALAISVPTRMDVVVAAQAAISVRSFLAGPGAAGCAF
jgi:hypothetical protein